MPHENGRLERSERSSNRHERRHNSHSRSRSRSPEPSSSHKHSRRHHHRHHRKRKRSRSPPPLASAEVLPPRPIILPFKSTPLSKGDRRRYLPMFARYLDIQKQLDIDELSEAEVRGRWKAFVGKWNRGELAEGWYDPDTLAKAVAAAAVAAASAPNGEPASHARSSAAHDSDASSASNTLAADDNADGDEDDAWAPAPPPASAPAPAKRRGPAIPTTSDLTLRDDALRDAADADRESAQRARAAERALHKERLEELAPRAEAGTRERRLEKRAETAAANRAFAEARDGGGGGGGEAEVDEAQAMGGEGGADEVKRLKAGMERRKNEREVRREEVLRARAAEREERLAGLKEREDRTMDMLKNIAKERFG